MRRILSRRTLRELGRHGMRYLALALMIALAMYLIVSLIGAADTIILGTRQHSEQNQVEDGQFTVFVPLSQREMRELQDKGLTVEAQFYRDYSLENGSVLRVFRLRQEVNIQELETGELPNGGQEILLEKRYCEANGLLPGDTVCLGSFTLTVSGIVTTPDYDGPFRTMGDSTADSKNFGTAFVTDDLYESLSRSGESLQAEEYLYAYRLNGSMESSELKALLREYRFDPAAVDDAYFQEYWERTGGKREELLEGAADAAEGSADLRDALAELEEKLQGEDLAALRSMLPREFLDSIAELREGGKTLADGSADLQQAVRDLTDRYWKAGNENLRSFVTAEDNPRIGAAVDDVLINKYASILAGVIVLALMAYVISVFVLHGIEEERSIIGTLYALGIRRNELLRHYLVLPVLVCFLAGTAGTAIGYSCFGVPVQTADTYAYFSVPSLDTVVEAWVVAYGVVMPPVIAAIVNWLVIRRKLSAPALQMIRGEEKRKTFSQADLGNMGYLRRFQLRQMLREGRSAVGVVLGIFICLLLMMIGINAYVMCVHVGEENVADTKYEYMVLYKYPEEHVPSGGTPAYARSVKKEILGYNMDVTILGLEDGNPYFEAHPAKSQSSVQISSAMAQKYSLKAGDAFLVTDPENDRLYAFTVESIVPYAPAFYVFMDIDSMRELFGVGEDYYNVVFSDRDLGIDPGRLYSVSTREDVLKAANVFVDLMYGMVTTMIVASSVIMAIVIYLMMKVMIDRSAQSIALFKVFGYQRRELGILFLNGNTALIVLGALISIPLSKVIMDAMYPYLVSNVACAINLRFEPWIYAALFAGILLVYLPVHAVLVRRIGKIDLGVVLKNRE